MYKFVIYCIIVVLLFLLQGCFIGTHSFNNGKLLNPGERLITTGYGWKYSARYFEKERDTYVTSKLLDIDSSSNYYSSTKYYDSTRFGWFNFAIDYRIGVLRKYPFGRGLETGFHLEGAFRGNQRIVYERQKKTYIEFFNPPLLEIDTRLGFADITLNNGIFHHNANWGWTIGQWIDNGWFWGYTAGVEFNKTILYSSLRYFITATDKLNRSDVFEDRYFKDHKRTHGLRLTCGSTFKLHLNSSALPEYITPEFSLIFPNFNRVQPVGFSFSIGISWMPGF
jgi:hypothetical protein